MIKPQRMRRSAGIPVRRAARDFPTGDGGVALIRAEEMEQNISARSCKTLDLQKQHKKIGDYMDNTGEISLAYVTGLMDEVHNETKGKHARRIDKWSLKSCSNEKRANRAYVLEAVKADGRSLQYASEELKSDREVVMEAIHRNFVAAIFIPKSCRNDPVFEVVYHYEYASCLDCKDIPWKKKQANWNAVKKSLLENPSVLTNPLIKETHDGRDYYNTVVALASNKTDVEPCSLPYFD